MPDIHTLPSEGFVRLAVVLQMYPFSRSSLWRRIKKGEFPQPVKLGPRLNVWDINQLREHQKAMAARKSDD